MLLMASMQVLKNQLETKCVESSNILEPSKLSPTLHKAHLMGGSCNCSSCLPPSSVEHAQYLPRVLQMAQMRAAQQPNAPLSQQVLLHPFGFPAAAFHPAFHIPNATPQFPDGLVAGDWGPLARRKNATRETTAALKTWLNDHLKNPYPTKGEKIMLAIITKMTLTQVSTWFANARRRLKKEGKMTWTPRNAYDDDELSDDEICSDEVLGDSAVTTTSGESGQTDKFVDVTGCCTEEVDEGYDESYSKVILSSQQPHVFSRISDVSPLSDQGSENSEDSTSKTDSAVPPPRKRTKFWCLADIATSNKSSLAG